MRSVPSEEIHEDNEPLPHGKADLLTDTRQLLASARADNDRLWKALVASRTAGDEAVRGWHELAHDLKCARTENNTLRRQLERRRLAEPAVCQQSPSAPPVVLGALPETAGVPDHGPRLVPLPDLTPLQEMAEVLLRLSDSLRHSALALQSCCRGPAAACG